MCLIIPYSSLHITISSITDAGNSIFLHFVGKTHLWSVSCWFIGLIMITIHINLCFPFHSHHLLTHIWGNHQAKHHFLAPGQSGTGLRNLTWVGEQVFLSRSSTPTEILHYCRIKKIWSIFFFSRGALNKMPFLSWFWTFVWYWIILYNISEKKKKKILFIQVHPPTPHPPLTEFPPWVTKNFLDLISTHHSCFFELKLVLQITQSAFIAASVKLSPLFHFGSLHLGFQNFLEKESTDWNMFSQVFVECQEHCE